MTKNVFITGASRGIGKAIAHAFAKEGYHLYLLCKNNLASMQEYASFLEKEYCVQTHCYAADLADSQALESLLDTLPDMDIIVNNAGISYVGLLTDMTMLKYT